MTKTTLKIEGMMCEHCEAHVNEAIRQNFNVKKVESSHSSGITEIIAEEQPDTEKLRAAVEEAGYKLISSETEPYEKKGFSLFGGKNK